LGVGETILYGAVASLVASGTFFAILLGLRPRFSIAPSISVVTTSTGRLVYRFKVVNRTRRPLVDVKLQLFRDTPTKVPGGHRPLHTLRRINLAYSEPLVIVGRKRGDPEARHARRFVAEDDLLAHWPDDQRASLLLRITCRDGITGTFRQKEQEFRLHDTLQHGVFAFGDSLSVVEAPHRGNPPFSARIEV